jgi:hypothetical protein
MYFYCKYVLYLCIFIVNIYCIPRKDSAPSGTSLSNFTKQHCNLCIFIVRVYVFLLTSMYSSSCLCLLIVRPCILNVVYVILSLSIYSYCSSMYSYRCLCVLTVVHVFLDAATLTEVFPCFSSVVRQMPGYN